MFPSRFYSWFSCVLADRFSSWLAMLASLDLADWRPRLALTAAMRRSTSGWKRQLTTKAPRLIAQAMRRCCRLYPRVSRRTGNEVLEVPRKALDRVEHKARQNPVQANNGAHNNGGRVAQPTVAQQVPSIVLGACLPPPMQARRHCSSPKIPRRHRGQPARPEALRA